MYRKGLKNLIHFYKVTNLITVYTPLDMSQNLFITATKKKNN